MLTRTFWAQAFERLMKTFAQAAASLIIGEGVGLLDVNWIDVLSVAGLAAVISLLTSIGSAELINKSTPDLTKAGTATKE